jgi:arginyl-tRNA--protein-N-Asp/Glu arginylyltransferase
MNRQGSHSQRVMLYLSGDHPCSYLDARTARTLFVDPHQADKQALYNELINQGFRRSGEMIYRPDCTSCQECISLRLDVDQFKPRRTQQRTWKRLKDNLQVVEQPAEYNPDHFALFKQYVTYRHQEGGMADMTEIEYQNFITSVWADSRMFAFHQKDKLVAVAATDFLRDGLSAVYTFFDPTLEDLSLGTFSLLWQIEACKQRNLPWLYLGYWIQGCKKMAYKNQFHPHEAFIGGQWVKDSINTPHCKIT